MIIPYYCKLSQQYLHIQIYVTGGMFEPNGTTSVPKSVPRLVVDKVKLLINVYTSTFLYHTNSLTNTILI